MSCCDAGAMSVQEALNTMLAQIMPVSECVTVSLANSQGHILAEDVLSPLNMPPFDNSAMDGYAFRFAEWVEGQALAIAGGSAKTAIVMLLAGISAAAATQCLEAAHGSVRHALLVAAERKVNGAKETNHAG